MVTTKVHGQRGRFYVGIASGGTAEPIPGLNAWSINGAFDKIEVTAFESTTKEWVVGKSDASGTYGGFMDLATQQLWTAATDGVARKFYLYPDINQNTTYWYGTGFFDASFSGGTDQAVQVTGNWAAATSITRVG